MKAFTKHRSNSSRRSFLAGSLGGAATLLIAPGLSYAENQTASADSFSCGSLDRELTQGPYYLDRGILRQDITEGHAGAPLHLRLNLLDAHTCKPIENAALEIWHWDASGIYSGFTKISPDFFGPAGHGGHRPPGGPPPGQRPGPPPDMSFDTSDEQTPPGFLGAWQKPDDTTFCRGVQLSNAAGQVEFVTIYPGWYVGRDTHIHLKVHLGGGVEQSKYAGGHVSHTGQLFFPDDVSDEIAKLKPYRDRSRVVRTRLDEDNIFEEAHSDAVLVSLEPLKRDSLESGFIATATVRIDPAAISHEHGPRGGGPTFRPR